MNVDDAVIIAAIQHVTLAHTHTDLPSPKESVAEKKKKFLLQSEINSFKAD